MRHDRREISGMRRVLITESDDLVRPLLEHWVLSAGLSVTKVAREADLIILSVPDLREASDLIRSARQASSATVMVISARFRRGEQVAAEVARVLGVKAALAIPFSRDSLIKAVHEAMAER